MGIDTKAPQFGHKGTSERGQSFAEWLLSGKPLARAPQTVCAAKLKPRAKPKFGRRPDAAPLISNVSGEKYRHRNKVSVIKCFGWSFWAILLAALMLSV
jgi:hypothetical protein